MRPDRSGVRYAAKSPRLIEAPSTNKPEYFTCPVASTEARNGAMSKSDGLPIARRKLTQVSRCDVQNRLLCSHACGHSEKPAANCLCQASSFSSCAT